MTDFFYFYNSLLCNSSKEPALSALQETAASFVSKKIEEISAKEAYTDKKPAIGQPLDTASLSPLSRFLLTRWARIIYLIFFYSPFCELLTPCHPRSIYCLFLQIVAK